ncbi:hypothetical protein A4A49_40153 [Nicotiana attenuata]|uniref:Uncharacterized protein n=1 Tax=Nicotiana attenuata TaxID=49451 RepID=A0A1J6K616_NICAT|nr:hypothetical protein A4A49_40153 [Nicotiana attenuata]
MLRISAMWRNLMIKNTMPTTNNFPTFKTSFFWLRKMSGHQLQEAENVMHERKDSSENQPPTDFPTITTPAITVPTDATAVPESPFVPDFDADPPIRPGDDDPNESLEASTPSAEQQEASDAKPPPF